MGAFIALMLLATTPDHMLITRPDTTAITETPVRKLVPIPVILKAEDLEPTKPKPVESCCETHKAPAKAMTHTGGSMDAVAPRRNDNRVNTTKPVLLVMFYSEWCGPCNAMKPVLRRLRDEGYVIQCLDVADPKWKVYVDRFNVRAVPHWVMFIDGMSWQTRKGSVSESVLRRWYLEANRTRAGVIAVPPLVSIPVVRPVPQYRPMPVYRSAPVYQRAWGAARGSGCGNPGCAMCYGRR